ncbi:hypothetical protein GCM10023205_17580 [Yinghuangia aomiensis]|uniref:Uncharacterized protein n=1 Tax=Yinghuangia aomiensis TaxID=676205 RepID=A0ABP9GX90_9ACTN
MQFAGVGGADEDRRHHRPVAAGRDARQREQVVAVPQVGDGGDRRDVEVAGEEPPGERGRGVRDEVDVQECRGPGEPPEQRHAVE